MIQLNKMQEISKVSSIPAQGDTWYKLEPNSIVFEYSNNAEKLKEYLKNIVIAVRPDRIKKHFIGDKNERQVLNVFILNTHGLDDPIQIANLKSYTYFDFGMNIEDTKLLQLGSKRDFQHTKELRKSLDDLYYSILCSCGMDYHIKDSYADKYEFFEEFGYEPSRQNESFYNACIEQSENVRKVFDESIIDSFPA